MAKSRQPLGCSIECSTESGTEDSECEETVGLVTDHLPASTVIYSSLLERRMDFGYRLLSLALVARRVGSEVECDSQNEDTDSAILGAAIRKYDSQLRYNITSHHHTQASPFSMTII